MVLKIFALSANNFIVEKTVVYEYCEQNASTATALRDTRSDMLPIRFMFTQDSIMFSIIKKVFHPAQQAVLPMA